MAVIDRPRLGTVLTYSEKVLTAQADDFPGWYQDVLAKAELAENGPVRGTMVIRPYGFAVWEHIQADMDRRIKAVGAENVYLPLFIPQGYLEREAEHVEGFSPELAVVTHAGGKELDQPVVVRPTSETVFGQYMSKWIQSYRDLPLLLNQWCNVVRWELRPRIFLRTSEFLWQEGHTAHSTRESASKYARMILDEVYVPHMREALAVPVVTGIKPASERFAGAVNTMACEAVMADGKALQMGTSHELGQNFARASGMDFLDAGGDRRFCWTTSWGTSTRMVGGLIMAHGDDQGLRLPPSVAPTQAVILQIGEDGDVAAAANTLAGELRALGQRARVDDRTEQTFGRRVTDWELKGVPVRIEIGRRDLDRQQVGVRARTEEAKAAIPLSGAARFVVDRLAQVQEELLAQAEVFRDASIVDVSSIDEALDAAATGWARIAWDKLVSGGEQRLRAKAVTVRCLTRADGSLPDDESEPGLVAYIARSY